MKRSLGILCIILAMGAVAAKKQTADRVLAIIYHEDGSKLICQSDVGPDLSGQPQYFRDVVLKELVLLDAKALKIPIDNGETDRHLARVQEQLGKSREELTDYFKSNGRTFDEAKKELEKNLLMEKTIDHRVKGKAFVSKSELEKEYNDNPLWRYEVSQAFVPLNGGSRAIHNAVIDDDIESGAIFTSVEWSSPVSVTENDIAPEKAHIKTMTPKSIAKIEDDESGITLIQMHSKARVPFEELKIKITNKLGRERYIKALEEYYKTLIKNAHIRYIDKNVAKLAAEDPLI